VIPHLRPALEVAHPSVDRDGLASGCAGDVDSRMNRSSFGQGTERRMTSRPEQEIHMTAPNVIHFEIVGKDQQALQRYWSDLFGWRFDTDNPGGYGMTNHEDTGIVVGVGNTPDGSAGHVTGYVKVEDIDATLARAAELGGAVIMPKFSPDGTAQLALVADPEGHVVGLTE
jgi:predicted enzyme related to lactoylglutathione lyase